MLDIRAERLLHIMSCEQGLCSFGPMKFPDCLRLPFISSMAGQTRLYSVRGQFKTHRSAPTPSATRTYQEELYAARRFTNPSKTNSASLSLSRLNQVLQSEGIVAEVRRRRGFVRPSVERVRALFKSRQGRFNEMFRKTLGHIMSIHESRR